MGTKVEMPNFLKLPAFAQGRDGRFFEVKARLNPSSIYSYTEGFMDDDGGLSTKPVTIIYCAGNKFWVDMTIDEVDRMMEEIDRGLTINDRE